MTNQSQYSIMDPWLCCQTGVSVSENNTKFEFEDNFTPTLDNRLPDSEEYLAVLEEKLKKIKADPNILAQLVAKREACMQELLNGVNGNGVKHVDDHILELNEPISNSQVLRAIAPQRQAINQGEVVEFIKYDQLEYEDSDSSVNRSEDS
ncbi:uncharacterized protein LOC130443540 isoform X1 [Diorhabda sublineata]|uniref:uncharacterized protein LOC130443540 isoform X1 n=2 Tax=Diorhabda sublineata TaxID=1163346 RepID=UPI0024E0F6E5|nr:uncharacterized protein LOC130443540 isoform X1 [Diorhabda sublineata]